MPDDANWWSADPLVNKPAPAAASQSSGAGNWWASDPVAPANPPRSALTPAKADVLPPEEPEPSIADVPRAALSGVTSAARQLGQAPAAMAGKAQPQPQGPQPYYTEPLSFGDLLSPSRAAPKIAYGLAKSMPSLVGGIAGGIAGAATSEVTGPVGPLVGAALGAGGVSAVQSLAPYLAEETAKGGDPNAAFDRALLRAGQEGAFNGASWALFGWAPFKQAAKDLLFQAFVAQPGAAVAQRGVENVEQGQPVTAGMPEAALNAAVTTAIPLAGHAAIARFAGRGAEAAPSAEPAAPVVPRVRTPEEIENEDGVGPDQAARVAAAEAANQPAAAAAATVPVEQADQAARDSLAQTAANVSRVTPEARNAPPNAPEATPATEEGAPAPAAARGQGAAAQAPAVEPPLAQPRGIRSIDQIMREEGVSARAAGQAQMNEIAAMGRPITDAERAARIAGIPAERAAPVAAPEPPPPLRSAQGEDLLAFLVRKGGITPTGETRTMDAHSTRPGLVRKAGMAPDYMREAMEEGGFFTGVENPTITDAYDLLDSALRGQKVYGNNQRVIDTGARSETDELHQQAAREEIRMTADEHGLALSPDEIETAALAHRGGQSPVAAIMSARLGETGTATPRGVVPEAAPAIEDIPFGRRLPQPPGGGAPLFGEAPRGQAPRPEAEPTIRNDPRQQGLFPTGGEAVQAQAARDQAGRGALAPKGQQQAADQGLFARAETPQPTLPTAAPRDARLAGLPEGAQFVEGRGQLGSGRWGVATPDKPGMIGNLHATPEAAAAEARQLLAQRAAFEQRKVADAARDREISARIRAGGEVSDSDLTHLGFRPGKTSRFDFLSPVVQRLFGISRAKVREAMGDALREQTTDMGAKEWWGSPRKALANAAAYAEKNGISQEALFQRGAQAVANGEAPHPEAVRAAVEAAQRITGGKVKIETYDAAHDVFNVRFPDGHTEQVFGYTLGRLIRAAIEPRRTAWNLNHESVHALEALGVFKPGEMKALAAAARRGDWITEHRIAERYPDQTPQQQLREAIAEQFARYSTEPRTMPPIIQRMGEKIAQFFDRMRNLLAGRGFRTADDVFGKMESGKVGAREPGPQAPTMEQSMVAAQRFEAAQGRREAEPQMGRRDQERELPGLAGARETMGVAKKAADEVKQIFAPTSRGPQAKEVEHMIRGSAAERARANAQSTDALEKFGHMVGRLPEAEQLAITDRRENGEAQPTAALNKVIDGLRAEQGTWAQKVRSLGPQYLQQLRENYMGHIWANYPEWKAGIDAKEQEAQARGEGIAQAQSRGKAPLKGSGAFLKQRTFDTQREGMEAGLIPVTTNPIEMQLLKLYEMQRFYHGVKLAEDIKASGMAHYVPAGDEGAARASGWVQLNDPAFQPRVVQGQGRQEFGNWWAPEQVARVFNNYVSPGLAGRSSIYDAVRGAGNALNSAQLSFSGFHATFIAFDTMMSRMGLGLQQLARGEPIRGIGTMAKALNPATVVSTVMKGAALRDAYLHPENATPQMRKLVQALVAGGGRIKMDPFYQSTAAGSFVKSMGDLKNPTGMLHDAWQMAKDTPVAAPMRIVGRLLDTLNQPLMGIMVPRAKLGVFSDLASDFMRRNPDATPEETAAAMTKAWDSVDNRMGQLVYDNLFWNKTMKDLAFITTRSVGWNLGSVREIAGGGVDAAKAVADMARGRKPELTSRMAYTIAMPIITGLYGAILNYAMTGQGPQSLLDYWYPRTGALDASGAPARTTMPGYIKDVMAFRNDPLGTIGNKTQPLIETGIELAKNRDYYGGIINMPGVDNPVVSYPEYLLDQAIPFSWRGWLKTRQDGASSLAQALNFFGVQAAPQSIVNPERGEAYQQRQDVRALKARMKENAKGRFSFGAPP